MISENKNTTPILFIYLRSKSKILIKMSQYLDIEKHK